MSWNTIATSVSFDVFSLLIMPEKHFLEIKWVGRGLHQADFTASGSQGALRPWGFWYAAAACGENITKFINVFVLSFFLLLYLLNNDIAPRLCSKS